jgi:hypothetical protein
LRRTILVFALSLMCGLCGTAALAVLADRLQWCCVNSWALLHDTGPVVFLLLALAGYHLVSAIGAKMGHLPSPWPPAWLAHTAYFASALGTVWSMRFVPSSVAQLGGGLGPNYALVAIGLITGILGVLLKIRGRKVRQFDIIVASLIVSCSSVVGAARAEWMMRHL